MILKTYQEKKVMNFNKLFETFFQVFNSSVSLSTTSFPDH